MWLEPAVKEGVEGAKESVVRLPGALRFTVRTLDLMLSILGSNSWIGSVFKETSLATVWRKEWRGGKMEGHEDQRGACGHCLCEMPVAWTRVRVQDGIGDKQPDAGFF